MYVRALGSGLDALHPQRWLCGLHRGAARSLRLPDAFRSLSRCRPPVALHWLPAQRALRSVQHGSPTGTANSFFRLPPVLPAPKHCTVARMHYLRGTCRSTGRKRLMLCDVAQISALSNGSPSAVRSRSSRSVPLCCSLPYESVPSLPSPFPSARRLQARTGNSSIGSPGGVSFPSSGPRRVHPGPSLPPSSGSSSAGSADYSGPRLGTNTTNGTTVQM
jgi:hypothetical protein